MNKIILVILLLISSLLSAFAQSFKPTINDTSVSGLAANEIQISFKVVNKSATSKSIKAKKMIVDSISGSSNYFCWGPTCYQANATTSNAATVAAGDSCLFVAYYNANGNVGISHINYCFFDANASADADTISITYDAQAMGIADYKTSGMKISTPFPHPANIYTNISYSFAKGNTGKIIIYDMIGTKLKEFELAEKSGTVLIPTSGLKSGMYFYTISSNGNSLATRKLIVSHNE